MLSLRQKLFGSLSTPALQGGRVALRAIALSLAVGGSAWASDVYADPVPGDGPALYAVRDADTTLYLYGTFHLLPPGPAGRQRPSMRLWPKQATLSLKPMF